MSTNPTRASVLATSQKSPFLKIGVTGHQERDQADWTWVANELASILSGYQRPLEGWTSLAAGADQVFARAILKCGGVLVAVIPKTGYEQFFAHSNDLEEYRRLLNESRRVIQLDDHVSDRAFFSAGRRIVNECQIMFAIWDGEASKGFGGTADVVNYARSLDRNLIVLNPITRVTTYQ
jgi:hypothetical protein